MVAVAKKIKIPSKLFTPEALKAQLRENEQDPAYKKWEELCKGAKTSNYRIGMAEFCLLTGWAPTEIKELHAAWMQNPNETNPVAEALGGGTRVTGYCKYLFEVREPQGEYARSTSSKLHTAVRSFIGNLFPSMGLPVDNIEDYKRVETPTYKPSLEEIRELLQVASPEESWVILAQFQMAVRPEDAQTFRYTREIIRQEEKIEKGEAPPIIVLDYTPIKTKSKNTVGRRNTAFGYDAYHAWRSYKLRKGIVEGDPLFVGNHKEPLSDDGFSEAFMRPARVIKLQERVGDGQSVCLYGLRGAGEASWEMGAEDKKVGKWVSGHVLPGVGENYFPPWRTIKEYERSKCYLNPFLAERAEAEAVGLDVKEHSSEIEKLKAENSMLRDQMKDVLTALAELKAGNGTTKAKQFVEATEGEKPKAEAQG